MNSILYHHGILGQRWGVRRYQNKDGSLTSAGKARYGDGGKSGNTSNRHRTKLEQKYRNKGASEKDAKSKASKRIRTEKAIAAIAGVTLVAAGAYAATRYAKRNKNVHAAITSAQRVSALLDDPNRYSLAVVGNQSRSIGSLRQQRNSIPRLPGSNSSSNRQRTDWSQIKKGAKTLRYSRRKDVFHSQIGDY